MVAVPGHGRHGILSALDQIGDRLGGLHQRPSKKGVVRWQSISTRLSVSSPVLQPGAVACQPLDEPRVGVQAGLEKQQVTAWAAIRNKADQGRFSDYGLEEVSVMHLGVSGFVATYLGGA